MGDSSSFFGGMWPEQASTEALLASGTGAPTSSADEAVFMPLQVSPTPMGNSEADDLDDNEESPAQFVEIRFMSPMGMRTCRVPWHAGLTVSSALHAARSIDSLFRLQQGSWMRSARVVGDRRVRMSYPLKPGDLLKLNPTAKPFL